MPATLTPAGRRTIHAVLQRVTRAADGRGGTTETWAAYARPWVFVVPLDGVEALRAGALTSQLPTRIRLPWRDDVSVQDRLTFQDRTLEVQSVADLDGRRAELELICVEVPA